MEADPRHGALIIEQLEATQPDLLLSNLSDTDAITRFVFGDA